MVSPTDSPSHVVLGARSPRTTHDLARTLGGQIISELEFLNMILGAGDKQKENTSASAGMKRAADADVAGPSKPAKAPRKSDPGPTKGTTGKTDADFSRVISFLHGGEIRMKGKTLNA